MEAVALAESREMLLTSDRIVLQILPKTEKYFRVVSKVLFGPILAPPSEAITGQTNFEIDPKRITDCVYYSDISEVRVDFDGKSSLFIGKVYKKEEKEPSITFILGEKDFVSCWRVMSSILGHRVISPMSQIATKLANVTITDLCTYLADMSFKAEPIIVIPDTPEKGIIRVMDSNFDFIVKDTSFGSYFLDFVISNTKSKIMETRIITKKQKGNVVKVEWGGLDKRFKNTLGQDPSLTQSIFKVVSEDKFKNWFLSISPMSKKETIYVSNQGFKVEYSVHIKNWQLEYLPPKEFFQIINQISHHVRNMATP
jgi:hypothetical protein